MAEIVRIVIKDSSSYCKTGAIVKGFEDMFP